VRVLKIWNPSPFVFGRKITRTIDTVALCPFHSRMQDAVPITSLLYAGESAPGLDECHVHMMGDFYSFIPDFLVVPHNG
jgi:hypothetical protein